jgi:hypothetical protein
VIPPGTFGVPVPNTPPVGVNLPSPPTIAIPPAPPVNPIGSGLPASATAPFAQAGRPGTSR